MKAQRLLNGPHQLVPEFRPEGHLAVFPRQWLDGSIERQLPGTGRQWLRRLAAGGSRARGKADAPFARTDSRPTPTHADNPPRLRRGMERDRPMDRAAAQDDPGRRRARPARALHRAELRGRTAAAHLITKASTSTMPIIRRRSSRICSTGSRCRSATARPLRLRVERQLGYKHAKYLTAIEAVASLDEYRRRKGRLLGGCRRLSVVRRHLIAGPGQSSVGKRPFRP